MNRDWFMGECEFGNEEPDEMYSISNIIREIEYDVEYLVDAPDEKLVPYMENLDIIRERLWELRECIAKRA